MPTKPMVLGIQPLPLAPLYGQAQQLGAQVFRVGIEPDGDPTALARLLASYQLVQVLTVRVDTYPTDVAAMLLNLSRAVSLVKGRVKFWQLGNEPINTNPAYMHMTLDEYSQLFALFADAVRKSDPAAMPTVAGLCSGCIAARGEKPTRILKLAKLHAAACDLHLYNGPASVAPSVQWAEMVAGSTPIVTECGVSDPNQVAALLTALANEEVPLALWHSLTAVPSDASRFQRMALMQGGMATPVGVAYQKWAKGRT